MPTPVIPWEPCNIPLEIQTELNRRKINRSFDFIAGTKGEWNSTTGDWTKYRGPTTPWIRFCSNGFGRENMNPPKPRFVFFGGKDFYNGYGFNSNPTGPNQSIIGYMPNGTPHVIDNDLKTSNYPIHVPPPEIDNIEVTIQKELYRKATIHWTCFSTAQLEYMTPYFLVPGITCILEWGWNHFNPASLLDLTDEANLKSLFNNPYPLYTNNILMSDGNYDVIFGIVTHFEWSIEGNQIKCQTEVTSKDRIYAGLIVDSNAVDQISSTSTDDNIKPLNNLVQFVDKSLTQFKGIVAVNDPTQIPQLTDFISYVKKYHPNNWQDYIYGVFYGRDLQDTTNPLNNGANKKEDFDCKSYNSQLWINLGLLMEVINFHSDPLYGFSSTISGSGAKSQELFRVDIDDVVIGAHPNLISTDGTILLIPNSEAPKYFEGGYGFAAVDAGSQKEIDYAVFKNSTHPIIKALTKASATTNGQLPDYRLLKVALQPQGAYRDDIDEIINRLRYENVNSNTTYEFPFAYDRSVVPGAKPYPRRYSGYLKNLYFNVGCLQDILKNAEDVKTFTQLIYKIIDKINTAAGNFWDLRLVAATGAQSLPNTSLATMKVVDYKFMSFSNGDPVYSFDYFDADSILQSLSFKPTLSNAQAIRTLYAPINNPDKRVTLVNGENELLNYQFRDALIQSEDVKYTAPVKQDTSGFTEIMRELQQISPMEGSYQISNIDGNGNPLVRRLCLPTPDVLKLLLDDGDDQNNPKYTGIMPGIQAQFTIQGIGGLRTFMMFLVRNLPEPYSSKNIVFRIIDVQESVQMSQWVTTITAGVIPLTAQISRRLGITTKTN